MHHKEINLKPNYAVFFETPSIIFPLKSGTGREQWQPAKSVVTVNRIPHFKKKIKHTHTPWGEFGIFSLRFIGNQQIDFSFTELPKP